MTDFDDVIPATTKGGYLVASASTKGVWWFVEVHPGLLVCHCPGARSLPRSLPGRSIRCRHAKRLLAFTAAQEAEKARPVMAVNPSAFVD